MCSTRNSSKPDACGFYILIVSHPLLETSWTETGVEICLILIAEYVSSALRQWILPVIWSKAFVSNRAGTAEEKKVRFAMQWEKFSKLFKYRNMKRNKFIQRAGLKDMTASKHLIIDYCNLKHFEDWISANIICKYCQVSDNMFL